MSMDKEEAKELQAHLDAIDKIMGEMYALEGTTYMTSPTNRDLMTIAIKTMKIIWTRSKMYQTVRRGD